MRAGPLYRRVTIQRATLIDDGYSYIEEWHDLFDTWASSIQEGGREFLAAAQVQATRRVVFRIRYRPGLTVRDRIVFDGLIHNIEDVKELGRADGVELHTVANASSVGIS